MSEATLKIVFPNQAALEEFTHWLDGGGEQHYWDWMDAQGKEMVRFDYHHPVDTSFPPNDTRRFANAEFCKDNTILCREIPDEPDAACA